MFAVSAATAFAGAAAGADDDDDPIALPAFNVSAERLEEFGITVSRGFVDPARSSLLWPVRIPVISAVFPNTAAARAGLKPGDRIIRADGKSTASTLFSRNKWSKLQTAKVDEVARSTKEISWSLEVQPLGSATTRVAKLTVPTPPPRWGEAVWAAPEGRPPASGVGQGPLADRARLILENGVWSLFSSGTTGPSTEIGFSPDGKQFITGFHWILFDAENRRHRMFVTQQRGHTEIVLETAGASIGRLYFLTSPSGAMDKFVSRSRGPMPLSTEATRAAFQREIEFWLKDASKLSAKWPLELAVANGGIAANMATAGFGLPVSRGSGAGAAAAPDTGTRAAQFLTLPRATPFQQDLLKEALAKIGADEENWAFTETSTGIEDKKVTVVRVDPSKSGPERSTLLKVDGKTPTPAQVKTWRDQARDTPATLGDLPPLSSVVDMTDIRIFSSNFTAIVFELPIRGGNAEFPAEKFQALFRVNLTQRAFEDITVKMREAITVASVVKIIDAGLQARFQTFDPKFPPQVVWLKAGGSARVLFVKITRAFETTRSDFSRVRPSD